LPTELAEHIFELIEQKLSADKEVTSAGMVMEPDDLANLYESRILRIWLMSVKLYALLAHQGEWTGAAATENQVKKKREQVATLAEILSRNTAIT